MKALNVRENISFFKLTSRIAHKEDFTSDVQKKSPPKKNTYLTCKVTMDTKKKNVS